MKRISTGGLRDKYQHDPSTALAMPLPPLPPVTALPKDIERFTGMGMVVGGHGGGAGSGLGSGCWRASVG